MLLRLVCDMAALRSTDEYEIELNLQARSRSLQNPKPLARKPHAAKAEKPAKAAKAEKKEKAE